MIVAEGVKLLVTAIFAIHYQGLVFRDIVALPQILKDGRDLRFESKVPTIFEYLRKSHNVPEYQTLIVNGEDRSNEEFYTFSNNHLYGINFRCNTLSLYRYKTYLLRRSIQAGTW